MKEGWKTYTLGELCKFQRGLTYSKGDEVAFSKNVVLRSNNVDLDTKSLDFSELKYLREDFIIPEDRKVKEGCFLICVSNGSKKHLGKAALIDKNYGYAFGGFMGLLVPDQSIVSSKYLWTILASQRYSEFIKHLSDGTGINNLKFDDIAPFEVPVPPLPEQERIVSYLDAQFAKIDALRANTDQQLQAAKDLFQSALKEMLTPKEGWEKKALGEVGDFFRGGDFKKTDFVEKGVPCMHYGQIHMHFGVKTDTPLSYLPVDFPKFKFAKKGDLIIAITSEDDEGSCKCTAWLGEDDIAIGGHSAIFRHTLDPVFMSYYFRSPAFQKAKLGYTHGFKVVEIKPSDIAKIEINYPSSLKEQQDIVAILDTLSDKVKALQENYNKTLVLCNDLKQSLLKSIFE